MFTLYAVPNFSVHSYLLMDKTEWSILPTKTEGLFN